MRADPSGSRATISAGLVAIREIEAWCAAQHAGLVDRLRDVDSFPEKTIAEASKSSLGQASKSTERSETLAVTPKLADALADGAVTAGHVDAVTRTSKRLDPGQRSELLERADQLVAVAAAGTVEEFRRRLDLEAKRLQTGDGMDRLERQRRNDTTVDVGGSRRHVEPGWQVRPGHRCQVGCEARRCGRDPVRRTHPRDRPGGSDRETTPPPSTRVGCPRRGRCWWWPGGTGRVRRRHRRRRSRYRWTGGGLADPRRDPHPGARPTGRRGRHHRRRGAQRSRACTHPASSTSDAPPGWRTGHNDAPSAACTPPVASPAARSATTAANSTTSSGGDTAAAPTWRISCRSAPSITARSTTTTGSSNSDPTENSPSRTPMAPPTPPDHPADDDPPPDPPGSGRSQDEGTVQAMS